MLLQVPVIVAAHLKFVTARTISTRETQDLLLGSWELRGRCNVRRPLPFVRSRETARDWREAAGAMYYMAPTTPTFALVV